MKYRIDWESNALDALDRLGQPNINHVLEKIYWLAENIELVRREALKGRLRGYFKYIIGPYRVIYRVNKKNKTIVIEDVGHRRDIYKTKR